jgi:hypothetical protein
LISEESSKENEEELGKMSVGTFLGRRRLLRELIGK